MQTIKEFKDNEKIESKTTHTHTHAHRNQKEKRKIRTTLSRAETKTKQRTESKSEQTNRHQKNWPRSRLHTPRWDYSFCIV